MTLPADGDQGTRGGGGEEEGPALHPEWCGDVQGLGPISILPQRKEAKDKPRFSVCTVSFGRHKTRARGSEFGGSGFCGGAGSNSAKDETEG